MPHVRTISGPHRNRTCHSLLAKQSRHLGTFQPADPAAGLEPTPQVWKTLMLPLTPCGDNDHDRIDPGLTPGTHETRKGTGRAGPPHTPGGYRPLILMRSCFAPALYRMIKTRLTFRSRYTGRSRRASTGENRKIPVGILTSERHTDFLEMTASPPPVVPQPRRALAFITLPFRVAEPRPTPVDLTTLQHGNLFPAAFFSHKRGSYRRSDYRALSTLGR